MKIAVLSDIHGNHFALKEVLRIAAIEHVDKLLILGDFVGYYYHPDKVLEMLSEWDHISIKGNHEKMLEHIASGLIDELTSRKKYGSGHKLALEKLSGKQLEWLNGLPEKLEIEIDKVRMQMCHGSPLDPDQYLYPNTERGILEKCDNAFCDFVFTGHSHYSFIYRNEKSTLINVGSVGQSRSMGGLACWAIINTENKSFEMKTTPYDIRILLTEIENTDPGVPYLKNVLLRNNH
jgi:putative phosphoesterase